MGGGMVPVTEQEHFRIRTDGTAADPGTPTWLALEDTNGNLDVSAGNVNFRIRFVVAETAGNAANSDFSIYYSKNAGSYLAVSGSSSNVQFADASSSVDATALTTANYQLTAGTGTAANGEYSEDAVVSTNISANNYVEQEYGLVLIAADLADTDTLDFRVYYNGAAMDVYDVTPRVTVDKTVITYVDMDSSASSTSTVAAALDAQIGFDSTTTSASTVAAALNELRSLDSALLSSSSVAALANALRSIDTGISGTSTLSSDMEVFQAGADIDLDSSISGTSTVAAAINPQRGLLSSMASTSTVAATSNILRGFEATIPSSPAGSSVAASMGILEGFFSSASATSTLTSELFVPGTVDMDSQISSDGALSGTINRIMSPDATLPEFSASNPSLNVLASLDAIFAEFSSNASALNVLLGYESSGDDAPLSTLAADFVLLRGLTASLEEVSQVNPNLALNMGMVVLTLAESSLSGELGGASVPDFRSGVILGETLQGDVVLGKTLMGDVAMAETVIGGMSMGETLMGDVLMGETPQGHVIL